MDEARDLLRDVKRRRQLAPLRGVLKKSAAALADENNKEQSTQRAKQLRFAEEFNEIYEIPVLDSSPSRTVLPMPVAGGPEAVVDWLYEATKAVSSSPPVNRQDAEPKPAAELATEVSPPRSDSSPPPPPPLSPAPASPLDASPTSTSPSSAAAAAAVRLSELRALAASVAAAPPVAPPQAMRICAPTEHALETLLWED